MRKYAIVSSYSESCGNASFTKVLHDSISRYSNLDVEVVELDLKLLQSTDKIIRKKGDEHIVELAEKLKGFDGVNIQLEAGLYGTMPKDIVRRTALLMKANPSTTVTMHSPRLMEVTPYGARAGIKKIMSLQIIGGLRELIGYKLSDVHIKINRSMVRNIVKNNIRMIVHTARSARQIEQLFNYTRVDVHPLKIIADDFVRSDAHLEKIRFELGLDSSDKLIGMFGYISSYKGHTDALTAMKFLPNEYKLLIFGRQHPQTLKSDGKTDQYLEKLIKTVSNSKDLNKRVFFVGELEDQAFWEVASAIDVAWLPYYENGQDGSGIASICMDACQRVLCSSSFAFDELFKLISYENYLRFDIGNYLEIAAKTKMLMRRNIPQRGLAATPAYNIETQAVIYVKDVPFVSFDLIEPDELNVRAA